MVVGGIEKALVGMLDSMDSQKYEVDLFVMGLGGEMFSDIPEWVNIKPLFGYEKTNREKIKKYLKKFECRKIKNLILSRISKSYFKQGRYLLANVDINKEYDFGIAYHTPASLPVQCVAENIKATKKIAWIHSDVSVYRREMQLYIDYYKSFEKIVCVSKDAKIKFDKEYPQFKEKTELFYNIINKQDVIVKSNEKIEISSDKNIMKLSTVGRFTEEKGIDLLLESAKLLKGGGVKFEWYIVGDGELREEIENEIARLNLQNEVILTGMRKNPYPFMKRCDLYVQPSKHEGYCITVAEAKILKKVVVATDFAGARDQIRNGENGIIINHNARELYETIQKVVCDEKLKKRIIGNLDKEEKETNREIEKVFV